VVDLAAVVNTMLVVEQETLHLHPHPKEITAVMVVLAARDITLVVAEVAQVQLVKAQMLLEGVVTVVPELLLQLLAHP
jgi:hypothetical protein